MRCNSSAAGLFSIAVSRNGGGGRRSTAAAFGPFYLSFSPTYSSRIVMDVVLLAALINRVGWRLIDAL